MNWELRFRSELASLLKLSVTAVCLWYLASVVPLHSLTTAASRFELPVIILIVAIIVCRELATSYSLKVLVGQVSRINISTAIQLDSMGMTAGTFLPSRTGALMTTPLIINRYTGLGVGYAVQIKTIQLVIIAVFTGLLSGIGILTVSSQLNPSLIAVSVLSSGIYIGFVTAAILGAVGVPTIKKRLPPRLTNLTEQYTRFDVGRLALAGVAIGTGFALGILRFYIISSVLGVSFPPWYYLFLPSLLYVVTVLPISFGGIGIAETFGTLLLTALGVPATVSSTVVVTDRLIGTYVPLITAFVIANVSMHRQPRT